ncbi:TrkA C-terminal domain-containing protein [Limosilactobacillus reuteri]|uniref:YidE/YbjL duplication n=1 Tax=Limosilactobacillus reuteri TaxID=1598 RepID=A0ABD6X8L1_LIMRT|nr:TrkA C-terminal domain-containing protein [Limosilactobacillus reuteri]MCC4491631.1 YidE/YbjL duplication [Limosilactobacillus reuteri]MDD1407445.1 TrkA C-terminal domain-containing protein [Limosilactobacillus reuteri]MQB62566.1 YidE/YbjL duplication [Limosilactobacillus reuteri]MQB65146.1 YidE/YbjL duplication [Limosilactobacillus reuteri]PTM26806.1 YidE/YbjL duplication [Limosilactobacillus reuteri]
MIHSIVHFMVSNQVFTLFICLAIGFLIGNYKIAGKFNIGATVGTLIVTLIVGQIGSFPRDEMLGTIFFGAFMFSVGYRIGPQLLVSLKLFGIRILIASIFWMVVAFLVGWSLFSAFKIGPGIAAGVISGALTQSATVASSLQTIGSLPVSQSVRATYEAQLPVAYALTYVFGTLGVIIFLRDLAPKILGISIAEQGPKMAEHYHFHAKNPNPTWRRTYRIANDSPLVGKTLEEFNRRSNYRIIGLAAFHDGKMTDHLEYQLQAGDLLTVIGYAVHFDRLMRVPGLTEVLTPTNAPRERAFVLGKNFKPGELALLRQHGVFVNIQDPISGNQQLINQLRPGDVISLTGNTSRTKAILKKMGRWKAADTAMNYSLFSLGIGCASLLGIIGLKLNSIPLQLGNGTAALIMGLILSSWIERHRDRKSIPVTVTSFLQSFGLTLFVGTVGLQSAQAFTSAIKSLGIGVLFIGAMISIMPHLLTLFFGRYVLKMEPLALIGAMTGSGTIAAAMNEISQKAGPEGGAYYAAAFTPAFVVGNIGITLLGPIFVALLS